MMLLSLRGAIACMLLAVAILFAGYTSNSAIAENSPIIPATPNSTLNQGDIILHWTSPGDDGRFGRARFYDIRYLPANQGPIDNETKWNQAFQLGGVPVPSLPGRRDSMLISGFLPGAGYYFAIKSFDESGVSSALSNSPLLISEQGDVDFLPGDANNSGTVDGVDLVYLLSYFHGGGPPPPEPLNRADCNGNCVVNGVDAIYLVQYLREEGGPPFRGNCTLAKPPAKPIRNDQQR
jgi:hypothetical protein